MFPGEYNVTTALIADEDSGSQEGTIVVTANGTAITGASLTRNFTNDPLFRVGSSVSSFSVANSLWGSIVNNGTMTYTGYSLSSGNITGSGKFIFGGTTTNANNITQTEVATTSAANVANNANITAKLTNVGTVTGTGAITLTNASSNSGSITQNNFTTAGFNLTNTGTITTNNAFSNAGGTISGSGSTLTFAAGTASNSGTITQDRLVNAATFTNTGNVTATLANTKAISGAGNLYLNGVSSNTSTISQTLVSLANSADKLDNSGIITAGLFNAGEITGDGTIFLNADSTNNGTITQGLVNVLNDSNFANNGMLLANAYVADGSSMDSNANNLGKDVENDGTLNLAGDGTLSVKVTGTGSTLIDDVLDNSASIDQTYIQVKTGSIVTTNASHLTADNSGAANTGIENLGTIHFTAGSTANNIYGTGRMDITGYVTNNGDIEQDIVTNSGVFTNNGDVTANFKNTNTVEGTGTIVTGSGVSLNNGSITQDYLENNGTFDNNGYLTLSDELVNYGLFNTNADLVTAANGIENEGTLVFTGGQNYNSINGTAGEVAFTGDATNGGIITQAHVANTANLRNTGTITATSIYNTGTLTTLGDSVSGAVENLGTYVISDHDNANNIIGAGGTTTILGDTTNTGTIMQETLKIANSGNLTTDADLVTASITNDGKLTWNAGTANENVISGTGELHINGADIVNSHTINQGNIKIVSGSLTSNADLLASANGITNNADLIFTGGTNANAITGSGTLTTTGDVTNNAAINQNDFVVNGGIFATNADLLTITNGITNNAGVSFTGGTNANDIIGTGITYIDGTVYNAGDISTDIRVSTDGHYSTYTDVLAKLDNRGTTDLIGANIQDDITGTGTTNILGNSVNNATIEQSNLNIVSSGQLTTDSDDVLATISNEGILSWNAGTANINAISGNGELNILGGDIVNSASISQGNINISGGSLTSNADLLASANGITNNADLVLTGGTNTNAISGTGDLETTGDITNQGVINQNSLLVSGGQFTSDASLLTFANGVTNNSKVSLTGGTNTSNITGTGTTYIDATVTNNGVIDTNIGVGTSGHYATTSDISKALDNNGTTDITNADVNAAITGTGTTNILGVTSNNSTITQNALNIASNGAFDTDIDDVSATITNDGSFVITGGTANANAISGNGLLDITGGAIDNTASISQGDIVISGGSLTSNADLLASANGITNNADLIFNGGNNSNAISGTGALEITGDVTNNAAVTQDDLTVSSGMFTTNADSLAITNGITNNAGITFTGGTNDEDITGTGTTYIEGTVTNAGDISTDIQINADANLGTTTDIVSTVENRGTIQLVDADITSTGRIKGTGVVNILGDTTNNNRIAGSTVNVTAGSHLTTDSTKVEASIVNDGTLTWTAGTANDNALSGSGELEITGGDIVNNVAISQGNITISGGSLTSNADLLASANGITNNADLAFTGGTNANNVLGTGDLTTTGDVMNKGAITQATVTNNGNFTNDKGAITADIINTGNFTNDEGLITGDVTNTGVFVSQGDFVIGDILNNGTYTISEGDNANDIIGTGSLEISGATINTGTIDQNDITVGLNGEFVASDISDITTLAGIDNTGILEFQSGNNTNVITGNTGALKVTGAVTNASGVSITQDTLNVATLGDFTADAGDLNTVNGITNTGSLTLGDGNTANNISGTGALTVTGTVNNTGNIEQQTLTNSGVFTSNADLLAFAGGITNTNKLDLTGGTNANAITGTGTTDFTGDAVNNATIEQATVTNSANLTNNGAITADFTNSGIVDNTAAITGAITNMGTGVIYSTADNLAGTIDNDGTIDVAGGTVQDTISGTGDMVISADLINTQSITQGTVSNSAYMVNSGAITADFTNSGTVDNTAAITGDITNSGELNSSATNLVGDITNTGTLNLEGGITQGNISSVGETNITADLVNNHTINQTTVSNSASLTNNNTITADDIVNSGTIIGKASDLVAANEIANSGTLVFDAASTGDSKITGTGDVEVLADTILTGANTYAGGTLIDGADLTVAGQNNIGTGDVSFSNNGSLIVTDAGTLTSNLKGNTAADNINVENAAALTLSGSIGAAADFNKAGAGTMTFTMASNSYTGDTYVDAGTLIGNTKNINNAVIGAAGTTIEFNDTADAQLNEINTAGTFVQSATGVLNVENNAFTANQVEVNSGIFAANRAITADTLNVNSGATLRGRGNITGNVNVNSGATLAPGNSIDTLTVTGDLNLASGSTTAIEINETPASDKVIVTGNANITDGANLTVSNENGRYFEWKTFDIMEAGAVNGEFTYDGTVTDYDASRIEVFADYSDPTKVVLTAKRKATDYAKDAADRDLSRNQKQVAQAIDNISTGYEGDITNALLQVEKLNGLNPAEVTLINPNSTFESALNDLGGVMYANAALTSLFNAKTAHVYDRIAKRNPSTGSCPTCHDNVWVEYYNQYDKVYADENSPRFTNSMSGALVGYDRSSDKVLLGVYGGFGKSDLRQSADTMDIDDTTFGVYAGYMPNENWIFKGTVYGGYQSYEGKRYISFMDRNTNSHYKGWNVAVDLEGGYQVAVASWVNIKPFVGVLSNYSHQQAFTERSADSLNLHVGANDRVHTQGRLGVQFDGKVGSRFNWYASAAVKQFFGDDYAKLHMSWELPNTEMTIRSAELGRTYFSGQVGVSYNITESLSVFGNLDTGVNNKSANCYGNLGLAYTW